jgi:hypothetical protein
MLHLRHLQRAICDRAVTDATSNLAIVMSITLLTQQDKTGGANAAASGM